MSYTEDGVTIPGVGYVDSNWHNNYRIADFEKGIVNKELLYAEPINIGEFETEYAAALKDVNSQLDKVTDARTDVENFLSSTESKRYYTNDTAEKERKKLSTVEENLTDLRDSLESIPYDEIVSKATAYNNALPQLKKGARIKMLRDEAEGINKVYKKLDENDSDFVSQSEPSPAKIEVDGIYRIEHSYQFKSYDEETRQSTYNHHWEKHEYINYWGLVKNGPWNGWPWTVMDDDIAELEGKILALGYTLPYDSSQIKDY